jgi:hypothetical protein
LCIIANWATEILRLLAQIKKQSRQGKIEQAIRNEAEKQRIMETRNKDPKLFHQLVRNRRNINGNSLLELNVGDNTYTGQNEIIDGFREHFEVLVNPEGEKNELKDRDYHTRLPLHPAILVQRIV